MTAQQLETYRDRLRALATRVARTAAGAEEQARTPTGGDAAGNLSNAPLHLADLGSEVYTQELNATLLENEEHIRAETVDALDRVEKGTYGRCENCGGDIAEERLEALPYARHCAPCASALQSGKAVNLNDGRPRSFEDGYWAGTTRDRPGLVGDRVPNTPLAKDKEADRERDDVHAAGTPGGGTAVGGLAGTNVGEGEPAAANLEEAAGSGNFDVAVEADEPGEADGYAGAGGGAVGGTPAGKRARGGRTRRGVKPKDDRDTSSGKK